MIVINIILFCTVTRAPARAMACAVPFVPSVPSVPSVPHLFGHRAFSLALPSDRAMFELDFPYWEDFLLRSGQIGLLVVMRGIVRGATAKELGISDRTFRRRVQEIENILSTDPGKFRLV